MTGMENAVESALRTLMADLDYDLHKALECDEETGHDWYPGHAAVFAEALQAAGFGNLHDAWAEGVATALNHAIQNDDGITLRLEHLDGRPWTNPYPKVSET